MAEKTPTKRTSAATCVCRTCNGNIISKNHPLDLFGEKAIKEGIGRDLEFFSRVKIPLDAGFPSRICRTCYISGMCEDGSLFKSPTGSRLFDPKEGRLYKKARPPPLHQV